MNLAKLDLTDSIYKDTKYQPVLTLEHGIHSFDSFHNSFFESYWTQNSKLNSAHAAPELKGKGRISLIRITDNQEVIITEKEFHHEEYQAIDLHFTLQNLPASRVYIQIHALQKTEIKNGFHWYTNEKPLREVKLAIIMCTFNKQEYVQKNLELLKNHIEFQNSNSELIIVDNASNLNLQNTENLHYFSQGNYGGAGGFTRGLLEARKMQRFSHYQFMDDDILLDPDMILRAKAFISFCEKDNPFAGAMLCMDKKNTLWEQGANYPHKDKCLTPHPCHFNTELDEKLLDNISTPFPFDYGGWWFYIFSEKMVEKVGLPYPFFIRGDDVEYSLRLKKAGYTNLSLPGVCVWHETFFGKTAYWLGYYNFRNYFTFSLMYFSWKEILSTLFKVIKSIGSDLLFYQYQRVEILLLAIKDILFSWRKYHTLSTPEHQTKLMRKMASIKDTVLDEVKNENIIQGNFQDIIIRLFSLNSHLIPYSPTNEYIIDSDAWKKKMLKSKFQTSSGKIIISNRNNGKSFVFIKDSKKFSVLLLKSFILITSLIIMIPIYRLFLIPTFAKYKTTKFWNSFLKLNS